MPLSFKELAISLALFLVFCNCSFGQQSPTIPNAVERQFQSIESEILSTADGMPEDKFYFTPENLHIENAEFKGVRTFAGQLMHLATDNILI
jgi:hypothetical protein